MLRLPRIRAVTPDEPAFVMRILPQPPAGGAPIASTVHVDFRPEVDGVLRSPAAAAAGRRPEKL